MPDAEALDTVTFAEDDGRTTLTILVEHTEKAGRDVHIESGMEDGLQDALDLLEEVARSLDYSGMLPCLRFGPGSRLVSSVSSAVMTFGRVSWGTITSSM